MKVFVLEDSPQRQAWFKKIFAKDKLCLFDNVEKAKEFLGKTRNIDIMFLDHDLDRQIFVDSMEANTGYQLAKFIRESQRNYPLIVVHSRNDLGANLMIDELNDQESTTILKKIPFPQLKSMSREFFELYLPEGVM